MKIGFSFGRCVNDILNGRVDYDDVVLIIARTKILKVEDVRPVIQAYIWEQYIVGDLDKAVAIAERLFTEAKLHQPRCLGQNPTRVWDDIWVDLIPSPDLMNDSVKAAWNQFQVVARLVSDDKPDLPMHLKIEQSKFQWRNRDDSPPLDDNF